MSRGVIIDQDNILLCRTLDLPISFYFLPGGHVEHAESVEISLLRELMEETGAHCKIKIFLGCLEYSFEPGHSSICHNHEYNFIFESESETLMIDDFCVKSKNLWQSVGTRLIATVKAAAKDKGVTQTLVVCGAHDHPKRKFLSEQNLQVTSEWFIGGIV